jgi:hypothetical protein
MVGAALVRRLDRGLRAITVERAVVDLATSAQLPLASNRSGRR